MPLFAKGSKLYSIVYCKCPHCQDAALFTRANPYDLRHLFEMPDRCPVCGQDFQIEPGFYLGAMWVSYPIVLGLVIGFVAVGHYGLGLHMLGSFAMSAILLLLLCPPLIRYSRVLYLHIFAS